MCNYDWSRWDACCADILKEYVEYDLIPEDIYDEIIS